MKKSILLEFISLKIDSKIKSQVSVISPPTNDQPHTFKILSKQSLCIDTYKIYQNFYGPSLDTNPLHLLYI
jgi:hypothetical protein